MEVGQEASVCDPAASNVKRSNPSHFTCLPVGGMASNSPPCVPSTVIPESNFLAIGDDVVDGDVQISQSAKMPPHALLQTDTADHAPVDRKLLHEELVDNR